MTSLKSVCLLRLSPCAEHVLIALGYEIAEKRLLFNFYNQKVFR